MTTRLLSAVLLMLCASQALGAPAAGETRHDFGTVAQGTQLEHLFPLRNEGSTPLRIAGVQLTPPLQLKKMPAVIAPGATAQLALALDTAKVEGDYVGTLLVSLDGQAAPRRYELAGRVVAGIEILPRPAFFLSTPKGKAKTESLEIVNREADPITLALNGKPPAAYRARIETVEAGRRFKLILDVPATAPAGRISERLELSSSSKAKPVVPVGVNIIVRERVYTFPDSVDFGSLKRSELGSASAANTQTLMVYQTDGTAFEVKASTSVPGLQLNVEQGKQGDRAQITASLDKARVANGAISGRIVISTNDKEFPRIEVPVTGVVAPD